MITVCNYNDTKAIHEIFKIFNAFSSIIMLVQNMSVPNEVLH